MKTPIFTRIKNGIGRLNRLQKVLLVAFFLTATSSAIVAFSMVRQFVVSTTSFSLPGLAINQDGSTENPGSAPVAAEELHVSLEDWDGTSRVNILLMGLDYRDWEAGDGPPRTDSMMLFTYDPATGTAGILSIPRDLWVEVPGFGHQKINSAYQLGEGAHLPGGGPGLAVKTVEQFLGVTINYYGQIDFSAFERFVDLIGGVKINVVQRVKVQIIGEEQEKVIKPGVQVLNGAYALAYARARHTDDGDFDRARRQQEILLAIRQQLMRPEIVSLLVTHAIDIYQDLSSGINTNMTLDEMLKLGVTLRHVNPSEISQFVIAPPNYVTLGTSPDGLSILKPITENIRVLRDELFNTNSVQSVAAINSDAANLMRQEAANVVVNNGSGTSGLADSTRAYLQGLGFNIVSTGNSDVVNGTTLIDYTSNPYTLAYLVELMGVTPSHIFNRYDPTSQIDVEVIVGPEWFIPTQ